MRNSTPRSTRKLLFRKHEFVSDVQSVKRLYVTVPTGDSVPLDEWRSVKKNVLQN